jgi:signal transduction histidine kinase
MRRRLPRGGSSVTLSERYDETPPVMLNPELLEWALENLIANAVSALEQKPGRIDVVVARPESGGVEITVTDSGRGMTPGEQRLAFEPGYTTKRRGWGLGLALARRVVEEYHRGRIVVKRSVPGEGTTMSIRMPEARGA